jgi:glycosyltransferase involved in cell wall biosynthesis
MNTSSLSGCRLCVIVSWREEGRWRFLPAMHKEGIEVTVLQPFLLGSRVPLRFRRLSIRLSRYYLPLLALLLHPRAHVWASWDTPMGVSVGLLKRLLGRLPRLPAHLVRDFHVDPAWEREGGLNLKHRALEWAAPGMDFVLTTSRREEELYAARYGFARERIRFYPDTPPTELFDLPDYPRGDYVFAYGNSDRDFDSLVQAAREFPCPLVILSQRFQPATPLPDNVTLVRDFVSQEELIRRIAGARCCVLPLKDYRVAAGQNVMLEIMTIGRPLVVSRNIATEEYATDGESALYFELGNPSDLRDKVLRLLQNPERAEAIAANGRKRALDLCEEENLRFLEVLRLLCR